VLSLSKHAPRFCETPSASGQLRFHPSGAALKLLTLVEKKGMMAVA
jgi:hypothetical protein